MKMKKGFVWDNNPVERPNGNSSLAYGQVFPVCMKIFSHNALKEARMPLQQHLHRLNGGHEVFTHFHPLFYTRLT